MLCLPYAGSLIPCLFGQNLRNFGGKIFSLESYGNKVLTLRMSLHRYVHPNILKVMLYLPKLFTEYFWLLIGNMGLLTFVNSACLFRLIQKDQQMHYPPPLVSEQISNLQIPHPHLVRQKSEIGWFPPPPSWWPLMGVCNQYIKLLFSQSGHSSPSPLHIWSCSVGCTVYNNWRFKYCKEDALVLPISYKLFAGYQLCL